MTPIDNIHMEGTLSRSVYLGLIHDSLQINVINMVQRKRRFGNPTAHYGSLSVVENIISLKKKITGYNLDINFALIILFCLYCNQILQFKGLFRPIFHKFLSQKSQKSQNGTKYQKGLSLKNLLILK